MSSFKNFAPLLSSLQDQADGKGTIAGSPLEDFLSIAGYETPGGGGGDFSGAVVKITNNKGSYIQGLYPVVISEDDSSAAAAATDIETGENIFTMPLYKGKAIIAILDDVGEPVITGDCEFTDGLFYVSGDCTITIS